MSNLLEVIKIYETYSIIDNHTIFRNAVKL